MKTSTKKIQTRQLFLYYFFAGEGSLAKNTSCHKKQDNKIPYFWKLHLFRIKRKRWTNRDELPWEGSQMRGALVVVSNDRLPECSQGSLQSKTNCIAPRSLMWWEGLSFHWHILSVWWTQKSAIFGKLIHSNAEKNNSILDVAQVSFVKHTVLAFLSHQRKEPAHRNPRACNFSHQLSFVWELTKSTWICTKWFV